MAETPKLNEIKADPCEICGRTFHTVETLDKINETMSRWTLNLDRLDGVLKYSINLTDRAKIHHRAVLINNFVQHLKLIRLHHLSCLSQSLNNAYA